MKKFDEWFTVKESEQEHVNLDVKKCDFISNKAADVYSNIEKVHQSFKQAGFNNGMLASQLRDIKMIFLELKQDVAQIESIINQL